MQKQGPAQLRQDYAQSHQELKADVEAEAVKAGISLLGEMKSPQVEAYDLGTFCILAG